MDLSFNPSPRVSTLALRGGVCLVIDDALLNPAAWVAHAASERLTPPPYPYPGLVADAPALAERQADFVAQHALPCLGVRQLLAGNARWSLVTTPPEQLQPVQWQCHVDLPSTPADQLIAASVLYLFEDPRQGGTSFYVPRRPAAELDAMILDSLKLDGQRFAAQHGVARGYMTGSNTWYEQVLQVPAVFNRMILYDATVFHSGQIEHPELLSTDPQRGRLTLNGFFRFRR